MLLKLKQIAKIANKRKVDKVIFGGDFFHKSTVSLDYLCKVIKILATFNMDIFVVCGNHDLRGHNKLTINSSSLGVLVEAGIVILLDIDIGESIKEEIGDKSIIIEGSGYRPSYDLFKENYCIRNKGDFNILVCHGMLSDKKLFESIEHTVTNEIKNPANITLCGHDHKGFGIASSEDRDFINIGSVARTDNSIQMHSHKPSVLIIDIELNEEEDIVATYKKIILKVKDSKDVFKDKDIANEFISDIKQLDDIKEDTSIDEVIDEVTSNTKVINEIKKLLDSAKKELDDKIVDDYSLASNEVYIENVELVNFKAHKHASVDFKDGLNVIVGKNNVGKSTILKAIHWVCHDLPKGDGFIRTGEKKCSVTVRFKNGKYIRKERNTKASTYYVFDGNKEVEYKGFSGRLPVEILNTHQMPLINLFGEKMPINYNSQLDPLFLVSQSGAERAKAIGRLTNSDLYDNSITVVSKDIKKETANIKSLTEREEIITTDLNLLKDTLSKIENIYSKVKQIKEENNLLETDMDICKSIFESKNKIEKLNKTIDVKLINVDSYVLEAELAIDILRNSKTLIDIDNKCNYILNRSIENVDYSFASNVVDILNLDLKLEQLQDIKTIAKSHFDKDMPILSDSLNNIYEIMNLKRELVKKIKIQKNMLEDIEDIDYDIEDLDIELEKLNNEMKKTSCPICGNKIGVKK